MSNEVTGWGQKPCIRVDVLLLCAYCEYLFIHRLAPSFIHIN